MRRKQLQPWVGLPNILCGDFVVPELLQDAATPQALSAAVLDWLLASQHQPARIAALQQRFTALHHQPATRHRPIGRRCDPQSPHRLNSSCLPWHPPGLVAGVDEAGPGPAGRAGGGGCRDPGRPAARLPVWPTPKSSRPRRREALFDEIRAKALCCSIAEASVEEIDHLNILQATMLAMRRAVQGLRLKPVMVLVDGNRLPVLDVPAEAIVKGDALGAGDFGGLHPGQGAPRPLVRAGARAVPAIRFCRAQGLRHGGPPGGTARAWR